MNCRLWLGALNTSKTYVSVFCCTCYNCTLIPVLRIRGRRNSVSITTIPKVWPCLSIPYTSLGKFATFIMVITVLLSIRSASNPKALTPSFNAAEYFGAWTLLKSRCGTFHTTSAHLYSANLGRSGHTASWVCTVFTNFHQWGSSISCRERILMETALYIIHQGNYTLGNITWTIAVNSRKHDP
jgi:hypothetical protein